MGSSKQVGRMRVQGQSPDRLSAIVADHRPLVRAGVSTLLRQRANISVVDEASTGAEALRLVQRVTPNFLMLSADLADAQLADVVNQARSASPCTHIVLLSDRAVPHPRAREILRRAGHSIVDWDSPSSVLIDKVRRHSARLAGLHHREDADTLLSKRELEVLRLVAEGLSNRDISAELSISSGTVKHHLGSIFERLRAHSRVQAINHAIAAGLLDARTYGE
jgi:DNA-binding NarL/FixJ family response regulator